LRQFQHCFVQLNGWYENDESVFIAMEYMHLGDLEKMLIHPLPEDEAVRIARQLNEGLIYMHEHDIVHRDLKPSVGRDYFECHKFRGKG
jgi:serine/threonine protein kinase